MYMLKYIIYTYYQTVIICVSEFQNLTTSLSNKKNSN